MQLTLPLILGENATISVNSASKAASYSKAPAGLYALSRGAINLAGGAAITMAGDNSSESYAISTETGGIVDGSSGGRFVIDGDIRAAGATAASGTLPQQNSTIKLNMTDNSRWDGASYITQRYGGHRRYLCTNERCDLEYDQQLNAH
ncbi:putative autotransported protein [Salmonella enterica subsp. enterica]|uniref:Putative autotransported protein n=1 Tax=Salmonella enterica I TaxID=59201 RepID=A0A3S4K4U7_SALET|nr:putative autotransported protein [Salmonella enterica subsp. enterica]